MNALPDGRAWGVWLLSCLAVVFVLDSPAVDLVVIAAASVVAARARGPSPFRQLLLLGVAAGAIRTALFALTGHDGDTILLRLPVFDLPALLGGATLGGPVTAEVLAHSLAEAIRLTAVMACFGAFLSVTETADLVRMVPRFLFEAALVVNIALAFAPQLARSARDIREAQQARGMRGRGVRSLPALVVPLLAAALERSIALAESMDARGYGGPGQAAQAGAGWRIGAAAGALAAGAGASLWSMGAGLPLAPPVTLAAAALTVVALRRLSASVPRTRYRTRRWRREETVVASTAALALAAVLVAGAGRSGDYDPYRSLPPPAPAPEAVALAAALALAGFAGSVRRPG